MYWHRLRLLLYSNSSYGKKKIHQKFAKFLARTGTVVVSRYHVETTPVSPGGVGPRHTMEQWCLLFKENNGCVNDLCFIHTLRNKAQVMPYGWADADYHERSHIHYTSFRLFIYIASRFPWWQVRAQVQFSLERHRTLAEAYVAISQITIVTTLRVERTALTKYLLNIILLWYKHKLLLTLLIVIINRYSSFLRGIYTRFYHWTLCVILPIGHYQQPIHTQVF